MATKTHSAKEIVETLRQVDAIIGLGRTVGEALKTVRISQTSYYRWRSAYGGLARVLQDSCEATVSGGTAKDDRE